MKRLVLGAYAFLFIPSLTLSLLLTPAQVRASEVAEGNETEQKPPAQMDLSTHNALITRLQGVLPQLPPQSSQMTTIEIRLADVYADRARLKDIAAGEKNCVQCRDAEKDRQQALIYYLKGKKNLNKNSASKEEQKTLQRINLQMGNLYTLLKQTPQAQSLYQEIYRDRHQWPIHSKAHLGMAEIYFNQAKYAEALKEYQAAEKKATADDKITISFRQAWSHYNSGKNQIALKYMQKSIAQARKQNKTSFHKDLMHDYATMLARNTFTHKDVNNYLRYSPPADKSENLKFFAEEADRLGNKRGSILIWTLLISIDKINADNADIQLKLAQNYYDLDQYPQTLNHLNKVSEYYPLKKCQDCTRVRTDFKSLLVNWSKKEKLSPTLNLSLAFLKYINLFPNDFEVIVWAGQVARQRKDLVMAYEMYERAAVILAQQKNQKELNGTLAVAIEIAESSGRTPLYERALNKYLELNPQGPLAYTSRYQLAYLLYKANKYEAAAQAFKNVALTRSAPDKNLQYQAAELSLDALKIIKKDLELRDWAQTYANQFKDKKDHYNEIARKVTINQIVIALKANPVDKNHIHSELKILRTFPTLHLSPQDQSTQFRTLILGAEKINDLESIEVGSHNLLHMKKVSAEDKELALKSLLWLYELKLDFKNALVAAKQMKMKTTPPDQRILRLGLLTELSGNNPESYFNQYLKISRNPKIANQVRLKLIRRSKNPWGTYERMKSYLAATPELLAQITLELYLKNPNPRQLKKVLALRNMGTTPEGGYLHHLENRQVFAQFVTQLQKHQLHSASDARLQKDIKERIRLLTQLKQHYNQANESGDLYLQSSALNLIIQENQRFYQKLISLPLPPQLSPQEKETYQKLVNEKAQPFLQASQEAEAIQKDFFQNQAEALDKMRQAITGEDSVGRQVAQKEFQVLKKFLPNNEISLFNQAFEQIKVKPGQEEKVRKEIQKDPLNTSSLQALRDLQVKRANGPLLAYLDERLSQLKAEERR